MKEKYITITVRSKRNLLWEVMFITSSKVICRVIEGLKEKKTEEAAIEDTVQTEEVQ